MRSKILFCALGFLLLCHQLDAHPMGNFSINHHSTIRLTREGADIRYILDFAEIPTFQMNGVAAADVWVRGLQLYADGKLQFLELRTSHRDLTPGAGGLSTMKVTMDFFTSWQTVPASIHFEDRNFPDRIGWKEIVVTTDGSVGFPDGNPFNNDRSNGLSNYSPDLLSTAPTITLADVKVAASSLSSANDEGTKGFKNHNALTVRPYSADASLSAILTSHTLPLRLILVGILIAFSLGALHALSPGHGKTIVAAYLVGNRGSARHALLLGAIVTFTHTVGVFVLGLVTLFLSRYVVPERLYPVLGFLSGVLIVAIGVNLFRQRFQWLAHDHAEGHRHGLPLDLGIRSLVGLGVSGGIIPCPSALVVLLSAIALHRIGTGMVFILAFSFGLASVLIAIGILAVRASRLMRRLDSDGAAARIMPVLSAAVVTFIGIGIAIQSLAGTTLLATSVSLGSGALFVLGLGLVLGLKHATDADHIVAVTTFVSEQRSILRSCWIGAFWGLGHTISLSVAGLAVIGLKLSIPEWLAARLEFMVAVMLVGLGLRAMFRTPRASAQDLRSSTPGLRPLLVGMVHGAAGSAALMLLVLSTIRSPLEAFLYILVFGLGSIAGMLLISLFLSLPLRWASGRMAGSLKPIQLMAGLFSCVFGLYLGVHLWTSL
jgi:ABC-type nickel/cobalt efflux system permease component RcnA